MKLSAKFLLCGLVASSALFSACSSMVAPVVVLRRMNDVGVTYVTDTASAEAAVIAAIAEVGGQYRFTDRFSANGAATVHGKFDAGFNNKTVPTFFEIDIDPVHGHSEWRKIRIGIGDFGNNETAIRFQRILMGKLPVVNEALPARNAKKLQGLASVAPVKSSDSSKVGQIEYLTPEKSSGLSTTPGLTPSTGSVSYHAPVVPVQGGEAPAVSNANAVPQSVLQYYE